MYKNQLQELAQRSCFNLPSYACIREGPDHAPRFKATVNFNGEVFESPAFFSTLRQAEHAAAEVALNTVAKRGPSKRLAAQVLDERGVYKNLLQETAHRAGLNLPVYTAVRSGPGHVPVFSCTVELAGMTFTGQPAKSKKHAEKNAAMAAWSSLKQMSQSGSSSSSSNTSSVCHEEQDKVVVARYLCSLNPAESSNSPQNKGGGHEHNNRSFPSTTTTSFPLCYPNSNISPEMAIHYMWMQQQQQQRRLMSLPIGVPPPNHLFPWMLHPTHHRLPYSFTDQQLLNRNVVTIQEINEEEKTNKPPLRPTQKSCRIPVNDPRTPGGVRGLRVPFVAQPVQIRSVVPVFSAPPRRETMNRSQESPTSDEMRSETPGEISVMSSKMGNLHI